MIARCRFAIDPASQPLYLSPLLHHLDIGGCAFGLDRMPTRENDTLLRCIIFSGRESGVGLVSRVTPVQTAMRNCTRDEGRPFGFGDQAFGVELLFGGAERARAGDPDKPG